MAANMKNPGAGGRRGQKLRALGPKTWETYRTETLKDVARARERLSRYARETDDPASGIVEAADLLDAARAALCGGA